MRRRWAHQQRFESQRPLRSAVLTDATLNKSHFEGASLAHTDLRGASLYRANLREADLSEADLRETDMTDADIDERTDFTMTVVGETAPDGSAPSSFPTGWTEPPLGWKLVNKQRGPCPPRADGVLPGP